MPGYRCRCQDLLDVGLEDGLRGRPSTAIAPPIPESDMLAKSVVFGPRGCGVRARRPAYPWALERSGASWRCAYRTHRQTRADGGPELPHLLAPKPPVGLVALSSYECLFLSGSPKRPKARLMVDAETRMPLSSSKSSQCS